MDRAIGPERKVVTLVAVAALLCLSACGNPQTRGPPVYDASAAAVLARLQSLDPTLKSRRLVIPTLPGCRFYEGVSFRGSICENDGKVSGVSIVTSDPASRSRLPDAAWLITRIIAPKTPPSSRWAVDARVRLASWSGLATIVCPGQVPRRCFAVTYSKGYGSVVAYAAHPDLN